MKVYLMRGLPGVGKSFWVRKNLPTATVLSTDDLMTTLDGKYDFQKDLLPRYHNQILARYIQILSTDERSHIESLVVDNTNIRLFELAPYYRVAEALCHEVEIVWVQAALATCVERNVHGVPPETLQAMACSFEAVPPWWKTRIVMG